MIGDLDDRHGLACSLIAAALDGRAMRLLDIERRVLRDPVAWASLLDLIESQTGTDLSEARALLAEWHAWHGGAA